MINSDFLDRGYVDLKEEQNVLKYSNSDLIIKAKLNRTDIQMLVKLVEGLGHLGVVTTTDKEYGEVIIQTTKDCWTDLRTAIENMPITITVLD